METWLESSEDGGGGGGDIEGPTSETSGQMSMHAPQKCEGGKKQFSKIHQTIPHLLEPIIFPPAVWYLIRAGVFFYDESMNSACCYKRHPQSSNDFQRGGEGGGVWLAFFSCFFLNWRSILVNWVIVLVVKSLELFRNVSATNLRTKKKTRKDERTLSPAVIWSATQTAGCLRSPEGRDKVTHLICHRDTSIHLFNGELAFISHYREFLWSINLCLSVCTSYWSINLFSL